LPRGGKQSAALLRSLEAILGVRLPRVETRGCIPVAATRLRLVFGLIGHRGLTAGQNLARLRRAGAFWFGNRGCLRCATRPPA